MSKKAFNRLVSLSIVGILFSSALAENDLSTLHRVQVFETRSAETAAFIATHKEMEDADFFKGWSERPPFLAQRLVGDSWEILSIHPMISYGDYFERAKLDLRRAAHARSMAQLDSLAAITKSEEDMFAAGPSVETLVAEFRDNSYLRVETLNAKGGSTAKILDIVERWNKVRSGLSLPLIYPFSVDAGNDVDVVFISFYPALNGATAEYGIDVRNLDENAALAEFDSYTEIERAISSLVLSRSSSIAAIVK